tara:strand:- start:637 stop:1026 length:390 start_codon:yes stop_codon:yes gene_type:complete
MAKYKLQLNHDGRAFCDCFNVSSERFIQMRDAVYKHHRSKLTLKKTQAIDALQNELGGLTLEESFLLGMAWGVCDYLDKRDTLNEQHSEDQIDKDLDRLKSLVKEGKSTKTGINIEGFMRTMKDGKHDF